MDRRQTVVQRAREFFGDRLEDVLHMVRQDRQELRGWQEPAHVRAAVRRAVREEGGTATAAPPATLTEDIVTEALPAGFEVGRTAAEPDRGQQREGLGQLLERGTSGLEKVARNATDLTPEEVFGLEAVLLFYARPALSGGEGGA